MITKAQVENHFNPIDVVSPRVKEVANIVAQLRTEELINYDSGFFEKEYSGWFREKDEERIFVYWNGNWDMDTPRLYFPIWYLWTENENIVANERCWIESENIHIKEAHQKRLEELDQKENKRLEGRSRIFRGEIS